jgi:hypothetical protein
LDKSGLVEFESNNALDEMLTEAKRVKGDWCVRDRSIYRSDGSRLNGISDGA